VDVTRIQDYQRHVDEHGADAWRLERLHARGHAHRVVVREALRLDDCRFNTKDIKDVESLQRLHRQQYYRC